MNLVFLWIEKYNGFENCSFNFGGEYEFKFEVIEDTKEIIAKKRKSYFQENKFYNNISINSSGNRNYNINLISCLAGRNGSGKTSLLKAIKEYVSNNSYSKNPKCKYLGIWTDETENGETLYFYDFVDYCSNDNSNKSLTEDITFIVESNTCLKIEKLKPSDKNTHVVYYSNFIDESIQKGTDYKNDYYTDISTSGLFSELRRKNLNNQRDLITIYKGNEIISKLDFFYNICQKNKEILEILKFVEKDNNEIKDSSNILLERESINVKPVEYNNLYNVYKEQYKKFFTDKKHGDKGSLFFNKIEVINAFCEKQIEEKSNLIKNGNNLTQFFVAFYEWYFTYNYWLMILNYLTQNGSEIVYYKIFDILLNFDITESLPVDLLDKTVDAYNSVKTISNNYQFRLNEAVKSFKQFLKIFKQAFIKYRNYKDIYPLQEISINIEKDQDLAKKIVFLYTDSLIPIQNNDYLDFDWSPSLSSGESSLITLLSRLNNIMVNQKESNKNFIFLIDEGDIGFHPQWQKEYISLLIKYIDIICINNNLKHKIQIIFTTNNPILLSDILLQNIIYFKDHKVLDGSVRPQSAFGSNILDLFSDSFFFNDGLIGSFAKHKINEVIRYIKFNNQKANNEKTDESIISKEECEFIINNIGDSNIKGFLQGLYDDLERKGRV